MVSDSPEPTVDQLLDRYIAAWHAGEAPNADALLAQAPPAAREELGELIAGFLELAPTIARTDAPAGEHTVDPLVARIKALESARWDAAESLPWGERLRAVREGAGITLIQLAGTFSERFGLGATDHGRAATVFAELEAGALPAAGVAARAARAIEEILGAARGTLDFGGAAPIGGALLRGELPESGDERDRLADLLRHVDDALPPAADAGGETLSDLLGG